MNSLFIKSKIPVAITALLPIFYKHTNTQATMYHTILLILKQTQFLCPGELPGQI